MNPTIAGALAGLIIGLPSGLIALLTLRQNRAAQRDTKTLEERKVGRDEFESLKNELRAQLADERKARRRAERRVVQLETALRDAGIEVPPPTDDPDDE